MVDPYVQRVLVQLDHLGRVLVELEDGIRTQLGALGGVGTALSASETEALRQGEQFLLGEIEGLVQAQLLVNSASRAFADRHRLSRHPGPQSVPPPAAG